MKRRTRITLTLGLTACLAAAATTLPLVAQNASPAREGEPCGVKSGACDEGLWCDPQEGRCNVSDVGGTCVKMPDTCDDQYAPSCGCNGTTYANDCQRIKAMAQKNHGGKCEGEAPPDAQLSAACASY